MHCIKLVSWSRSKFRPAPILNFLLGFFVLSAVACNKEEEQLPPAEYPAAAEHWAAGEVRYGMNNWMEVTVGDIPLVISVPHGGTIRPEDVPDRGCPNATTVRDMNTIELARAIEKEFIDKYGVRPYIVINHLSRAKIDPNRDIMDATCGNETMQTAWRDYHNFLDSAVSTAATRHGHALLIDLHGHGHANKRLEIGYLLDGQELTQLYGNVKVSELAKKSSVRNLLQLNNRVSFRDLIVGENAFGTVMADKGIPSVPSKDDPFPFEGEAFFNGGYITQQYTSDSYPTVYGWQIECHNEGVRDTAPNRANFAKAFAETLHGFSFTSITNQSR